MRKEFQLTQKFSGYQHKKEITSLPPGVLVPPSQNFLFADDGLPSLRKGYTLYGPANAALTPIQSSYDWNTSTGTEQNVRFYNGTLEYKYVASDGTVTWRTLMSSLTATATLRFAEFWDTTEKEDILLWVDGTANIFKWSGAVGTIASVGINTLTLAGGGTWAQSRFLTSGTRKVTIGGVDYTYTGGESTDTLTGATPDPALSSIVAGDIVHQTPITLAVSAMTLPAQFATTQTLNLIRVLNNQVWTGSTTSRYVFVSQQNSLTTYTQSTPRVAGEGDVLTLDGAVVGFATPPVAQNNNQSDVMYLTAGKNFWYMVSYQKSADFTKESAIIKRISTTPKKAAQSQELIEVVGSGVYFISNANTLESLSQIQGVDTPSLSDNPLSDPVKTDFDDYDFSNGSLKYFGNLLHVCLPVESLDHPYNVKEGFWECPQVLPIRCLAVIANDLYMHSSMVPETYKLFDGTNDNTNPIDGKAYFSYQNYGAAMAYKQFTRFASSGYIPSNGTATLVLKYEFGGFRTIKMYSISGTDASILFGTIVDNSLGKWPIGEQPIGGVTDSIDDLFKFRQVNTMNADNFFELQVGYEINEVDQQFKILFFGPDAVLADSKPVPVTK